MAVSMKYLAICLSLCLCMLAVGQDEPVAPGFSPELSETPPFGPAEPPVGTVTPAQISALENQLHDTMQQYLTQRGWLHNCDAPGGCWLWEKVIKGQSYRLGTDDALNVEYVVQHEEEEEILRLHVSP